MDDSDRVVGPLGAMAVPGPREVGPLPAWHCARIVLSIARRTPFPHSRIPASCLERVMKNPTWKVQTHNLGNGEEIQIIVKLTASHMNYSVFHPSYYCDLDILCPIEELVTVIDAPSESF